MVVFKNGETRSRYYAVNFNPYAIKADQKASHLHKFKPVTDSEGNRAERRRAQKINRKKTK